MTKNAPLQLEELSLENLKDVEGGALAITVDREIKRAYHDCQDCPENKAARVVTIKLKLKPSLRPAAISGRSEFEGCTVGFSINGTTPPKEVEIKALSGRDGTGLRFNPGNSDNPRQMTIQEEDGDE